VVHMKKILFLDFLMWKLLHWITLALFSHGKRLSQLGTCNKVADKTWPQKIPPVQQVFCLKYSSFTHKLNKRAKLALACMTYSSYWSWFVRHTYHIGVGLYKIYIILDLVCWKHSPYWSWFVLACVQRSTDREICWFWSLPVDPWSPYHWWPALGERLALCGWDKYHVGTSPLKNYCWYKKHFNHTVLQLWTVRAKSCITEYNGHGFKKSFTVFYISNKCLEYVPVQSRFPFNVYHQ
jgi:hypothetical protein